MRVLGLDVGSHTVGIAISDELGWTAQALTVIRRQNLEADLKKIAELIRERGAERVVVGLPLHMNGEEGPEAARARKFAQAVERSANCPVEMWDERLSTVAAER